MNEILAEGFSERLLNSSARRVLAQAPLPEPGPCPAKRGAAFPRLKHVVFRSPPRDAPSFSRNPWQGILTSVLFHGLVVLAASGLGLFSVSPEPAPPVVMELSLDALPGPGGVGGDGQAAGGGQAWDSEPAAGVASGSEAAAAPLPQADTSPSPARNDDPTNQASLEPTPVLSPHPVAAPDLPKPVPAPARPKPAAAPAKRPAAEPKVAKAAKATASEKSPSQDASEKSGDAPAASPDPGAGQGSGPAGDGPGKGLGLGQGPAGNGGEGPGGGGGGGYVGRFGQGDGPRFRHRVAPRYPDAAKRANKEGQVVLQLALDAQGTLLKVEVLVQNGLEFVEEAVRALRASSFLPASRHGQAIPCLATLAIHFKLDN